MRKKRKERRKERRKEKSEERGRREKKKKKRRLRYRIVIFVICTYFVFLFEFFSLIHITSFFLLISLFFPFHFTNTLSNIGVFS
jgi:cell division septal protein FtsQ